MHMFLLKSVMLNILTRHHRGFMVVTFIVCGISLSAEMQIALWRCQKPPHIRDMAMV